MKNLILIRHGETDFTAEKRFCGSSNPSLNSRGFEQAKTIGTILKREPIDLILSSPLTRALETAHEIGKVVRIEPNLRECSFGLFEGKTAIQCESEFPEQWNAWCTSGTISGNDESMDQFELRITELANWLVALEQETIAVVTHGGVIRLLLSLFLWGDTENQWKVKIETGSIARIEFDGDFAFLKSLNEGIR